MSRTPLLMTAPSHLPDGLVPVAMAADRGKTREWSTVLLAKGVPHWTAEVDGGIAVFVPPDQEDLALTQLAAYDREQRQERELSGREAGEPPALVGSPVPGLVAAVAVLSGVHGWRVAHGDELARKWARDGVEIFEHGEWWRVVTALLVHADLAHLLGNLSFGVLLMWFVVHAYGRRLGWIWALAGGALGNVAVAAMFYPERFAGVGASTAVFAAVGLLVVHGMVWSAGGGGRSRHRAWLVPLGGGLGLLGVFGSGGEDLNVDLAAHVAGFAGGMVVGLGPSWWQRWCRVRQRPVREAAVS